ncbi:MAG: HIT family protein, partial [Nanoarchaeota archaeon]|nr:HIT family protein [Nanoarchaeota archaeon]
DNVVLSVLDINPILKGHSVLLPKEHYPIMPYLPADEFKHLFGITAQLTKSIKKAMVRTGINIFIANGGAAGQQAPHFLIHFLPREPGDGFFNFWFKKKVKTKDESVSMLSNNLPIMMKNHFARNPAQWHKENNGNDKREDEVPSYLQSIKDNAIVLYEDEKVLAVANDPNSESIVEGHIKVYSKEEEKYFENLSEESAAHLFYVASFAATTVFEGMKVHATNIILKSGECDDNPNGKLEVHIIPRMGDDGLKLNWEPKQPSYDLDEIAKKIKDKTWNVKYGGSKENKKNSTVDMIAKPEIIKISDKKLIAKSKNSSSEKEDNNSFTPKDKKEEIRKAIERLRY